MKMIYICNIMDFSPLLFNGINSSSSWFLPPAPLLDLPFTNLQNDLQVSFSSYDMHASSSSYPPFLELPSKRGYRS